MKVLIIGSGGREHTLAWKIKESSRVEKIFAIPGNAGIAELAECAGDIKVTDLCQIIDFVKKNNIDMTVVGPELPLTLGIVDAFRKEGLKIFGPGSKGALLEGSKAFAKQLMKQYNIPTAGYQEFLDREQALRYIERQKYPLVIKADGLAAGKGVIIAENIEEAKSALGKIMRDKVFGAAGDKVIIEEYLTGEEVSILSFSDGETIIPMASSQDHKRIFDGDKGPNTGGMGAYSPAPVVTDDLMNTIKREILEQTIWGLKQEGISYEGVLYAGLMITKEGPKVLEFNVRFGDPETQCILPRLDTPLIDIIEAVLARDLKNCPIQWKKEACVTVVMAAYGYPGNYDKGMAIKGLPGINDREIIIFHAGTKSLNGKFYVNGGRVLGVTALGEGLKDAIDRVYSKGVGKLFFEGMSYRKDIGQRGLKAGTPVFSK